MLVRSRKSSSRPKSAEARSRELKVPAQRAALLSTREGLRFLFRIHSFAPSSELEAELLASRAFGDFAREHDVTLNGRTASRRFNGLRVTTSRNLIFALFGDWQLAHSRGGVVGPRSEEIVARSTG